MKHMWDDRYSTGQYIYGKESNGFFSTELRKRIPGRILLPGEGEGRNAVHAALSGWEVDAFDQSVVGLIFFHAGPDQRNYLHRRVYESLKPCGRVILEAFHKQQLGKNSGGPGSLDLLFDEELILSDFSGLEPVLLEKQIVTLNEGSFHQGEASVIRFTGVKPD